MARTSTRRHAPRNVLKWILRPLKSTGYWNASNILPISRSLDRIEKGLASLQGLDLTGFFWLPDLGSNQGPTD